MIYIFVENAEEALQRLDIRVRKGGHTIPKADIRRRFGRSASSFWKIYKEKADIWQIFLNNKDEFIQVAIGTGNDYEIIEEASFKLFKEAIS